MHVTSCYLHYRHDAIDGREFGMMYEKRGLHREADELCMRMEEATWHIYRQTSRLVGAQRWIAV